MPATGPGWKKLLQRKRAMITVVIAVLVIIYFLMPNRTVVDDDHILPKERRIPPHLRDAYTLNGKIPVKAFYLQDYDPSLPADQQVPYDFTPKMINNFITKIKQGGAHSLETTDKWLYEALKKYGGFQKKQVLVLGSMVPWYESVAIAYGAKDITTLELVRVNCTYPGITVVPMHAPVSLTQRFDIGFAISTLEHVGLGRYGDPLDPEGDFKMMEKLSKYLKPDAKLFLAVPVGPDKLYWNAYRVYGKLRLPLLLSNWTIVDTSGYDDVHIKHHTASEHARMGQYQPVFVLENRPPFSFEKSKLR